MVQMYLWYEFTKQQAARRTVWITKIGLEYIGALTRIDMFYPAFAVHGIYVHAQSFYLITSIQAPAEQLMASFVRAARAQAFKDVLHG